MARAVEFTIDPVNGIREDERGEFKGNIIDIFEDFLDEKGIQIDNPEKEEDENLDPDDAAIIFGSDYDFLSDRIEQMMFGWEVFREKTADPMETAEKLPEEVVKAVFRLYGDHR